MSLPCKGLCFYAVREKKKNCAQKPHLLPARTMELTQKSVHGRQTGFMRIRDFFFFFMSRFLVWIFELPLYFCWSAPRSHAGPIINVITYLLYDGYTIRQIKIEAGTRVFGGMNFILFLCCLQILICFGNIPPVMSQRALILLTPARCLCQPQGCPAPCYCLLPNVWKVIQTSASTLCKLG